jgi:hypothetical protein
LCYRMAQASWCMSSKGLTTARPPFKIGDVLYAVNGVLFTSLDGMPRYVHRIGKFIFPIPAAPVP